MEANNKTHDLREDEVIVKVQRMFPNCEKYKSCCTRDKDFWDRLEKKVEEWKPVKQPFRTKTIKDLKITKPPEGFEGW